MKEALAEGYEEQEPEGPDDHPLRPTGGGYHHRHKHTRRPDQKADRDEHPSGPAVVAEVPGPDAFGELERRERQVDTAKDNVQCCSDRELEEAGIVRLLEVVGGGGPDADERQEADRHEHGPTHAFSHHSLLSVLRRFIRAGHSPACLATVHQGRALAGISGVGSAPLAPAAEGEVVVFPPTSLPSLASRKPRKLPRVARAA